MSGARTRLPLAFVAIGGVGAGLWVAGRALEGPPLRSWNAVSRWYEVVGPTVAAMAMLRMVGLGLAGWILLATTAELMAEILPRSGFRLVADLITPRSLQRMARGLAGLSLTAGLTAAAPSAGTPAEPQDGVAVVRLVSDPPPAPAATPTPMGTATMRLVDPDPRPQVAPVSVAVTSPDVVVVEPGDSLWSIAEEAMRDAGRVQPSDAMVARYWRQVIEANRAALVDPSNPDLIYPGQVITLPSA